VGATSLPRKAERQKAEGQQGTEGRRQKAQKAEAEGRSCPGM
jgi:hypothetical protein